MQPEVLEVAPGTFAVAGSHTNFVLLVDGDEATLVDTGYPKDRALVEAAVGQVGLGLADVRSLLLTHAHVDHIGSAEWLRAAHDVPVRCHRDEAAHARGEVDQVISTGALLSRLWHPKVFAFVSNAVAKGGLQVERVRAVTTFTDGETLDVPGAPEALHTPGHTSGHVSFHLPSRGVLLSGDALITVDVWDRSRRGPQLIREPFNHDHAQAVESLALLEAVEAEVVVPGHGRPYRGTPAQAVDEARRRLR